MDRQVCVENVSLAYQRGKALALDGVTLEIENGMFGLLGPNGAGKTTLLRILATLLPQYSGKVIVGGIDVKQNPHAVRMALGYLPQDFNTYRQLTIAQVLDYIALLKGLGDKSERARQVGRVLELVHLEKQRQLRIRQLSGGMRQRVGIAQALIGEPWLLIVDEPTAGLDPEERIRFRNFLAELSADRVVVLSTHIVGDVESSCYRLAVLDQGRIKFSGTPEALANSARGQVWEITSQKESAVSLPDGARVVAARQTAAGLHQRVLCAEKPAAEAIPVTPALEDGYLVAVSMQRGAMA